MLDMCVWIKEVRREMKVKLSKPLLNPPSKRFLKNTQALTHMNDASIPRSAVSTIQQERNIVGHMNRK